MIEQGEVYLVDFAKKYNSEFGKVRPAVVLQNNFLNRALEDTQYQSVLVVPLSTQDIQTEYKIEIGPRDNLKEKSFIVANWLCTLDFQRIQLEKGVITKLSSDELQQLKSKVCDLI
ncbi:type II toxin-antitoxin system PemK/MazF family toxin [Hydrogenimonas thermophila]|uniref:mRNA interferase MazF n=1 Tax=Hydrogenimonas thermophila TaxID=223786 RepID=A0A1I5TJN0_9BACT|nr:type II toxin-antitoxin system PemK/MazF family toxin [Hydrogenimonas thermophila]WOE71067.1 type II toxin-antitoxin system PemK/MazF family toxin [Hydrogenimonas thermophila]WOE73585.1 type II toxin-antitoxin system PemK/MazF family toxin [Hydrogenimonas thermophila]SFP83262.1 mRNA interferase MazF [Hydrogenimonas thermophila]